MHEKEKIFLDSVCANIKYKPAHQDIRDELTIHINELKEEFLREAENEEAALQMALTLMGDCDVIGRELNKRHKPEMEWSIIGLTVVIAVMGGFVMYASNGYFEYLPARSFEQYLFYAGAGVLVMTGLYFFDYTSLRKLALPIYIFALSSIVVILVFTWTFNGGSFFSFAGSRISTEFTTLLFLISFAGFVDKARGKGSFALLGLLLLGAISLFPIITRFRFSQMLTLLIGYSVLILVAVVRGHFGGCKKRQFIILGTIAGLCGFGFLGYIFSASYRVNRLLDFITGRHSDPNGADYMQIMADKWLTASSLFGATNEKVNGGQLIATLPCATTDYVLINVFATMGKAVGIAFIVAIAVYIGRLFITTGKIKNSFGFYLSLGACTVLATQFVTGILVNLNLLPFFGVYVPFVSYGGVGYINSMAFIGLVLSVWRRNNLLRSSGVGDIGRVFDFIEYGDGRIVINLTDEV